MPPPPPRLRKKSFVNQLFTGDNLYILNGLNSASVDLIYLDPSFNSGAPPARRSAEDHP